MLMAGGIAPNQIAAITFTEAAASELQERIGEYARQLAAGTVPPPLESALPKGLTPGQLKAIVENVVHLDELTCTTIHGFCQRLIRPYPVESRMDPGAVMMDEADGEVAFDLELNRWLREKLDAEGAENDALTVAMIGTNAVAFDFLNAVANNRRRWRSCDSGETTLSADALNDLFQAISRFESIYVENGIIDPVLDQHVQDFRALSQHYQVNLGGDPSFRQLWAAAHPPALGALVATGEKFRQLNRKTAYKSACAAAGKSGQRADTLYQEVNDCYKAIEPHFFRVAGQVSECIIARLIGEMGYFDQCYAEYKRAAALMDFDDLLYFARDLLRGNKEVRDALAARYLHVLVDEFQDTDPIQCEILFHLCGEDCTSEKWLDRPLRPGQLFLVGDPKQSIYRFRRADIGTYQQVKSYIAGSGSVVSITANFRSRKAILTHVNEQFAKPLEALGFAPLETTHPDQPGQQHVARVPVPGPGELKDSALLRRKREAEVVASVCAKVVGNLEVFDVDTKMWRPCEYRDIALLAPVGSDLWVFERALERHGLPLASQAGKGLFRQQEIHDLIAIARVLSNRRDTLALGALLRGPLVGLTENEILNTMMELPRHEDGSFASLTLSTDPQHISNPVAKEVIGVMKGLARKAYSTTPFDLMAAAVDELRVRPKLALRNPNYAERALANVDQFLEMARPFAVRGLRRFAQFVNERSKDNESVQEGRCDANADAIQLITVHSAKGLEWPVVIPVNLTSETGRSNNRKVLYDLQHNRLTGKLTGISLPPSYVDCKVQDEAQEAEQRKRLLYVLLTRARDYLIVPHHDSLAEKDCWFNEVDLNLAALPAFALDAEPQPTVRRQGENLQDSETFRAQAAAVVDSVCRIHWLAPSTSDTGEDEPVVAQPMPALPEMLIEPPAVRGSTKRGLLLHKLMEEVINGILSDEAAVLEVRARVLLDQLGVPATESASDGIRPKEIAQSVLRGFALPIVAEHRSRLVAELPVYEAAKEEDKSTTATAGIVDALAIGADGKPLFAFDWKSTVNPTPADIHHHAGQLRIYLKLLGIAKGALIYLTTGQAVEVPASNNATVSPNYWTASDAG